MTFDEYQKKAKTTAIYPKFGGVTWVYPALGLASEAGEVANKLKKVIRDQNGAMTDEVRQAVKAEIGDALWYISQLAGELDFKLEDVASSNLAKLSSRKERGKLQGKGDNR